MMKLVGPTSPFHLKVGIGLDDINTNTTEPQFAVT